ncbi:MAG: conjugal transfer protein TrbI [Sphingomonas sp.]|uniref:TrbI/VirB10 family protein n=1 Tax=Sphingomonas sp. TaxID=28214 RepID=UPI002274CFDB|nr:TrbI/VirB10 family protein [Sphingomonas sp.]MCX8477448.1 conjugal transfer protein TrbI [Sphingomonas sp.]
MATAPPSADPRTTGEASVLPVVARPRAGVPIWAILLGVALVGLLLFAVLDARRRALTAPAVRPRSADLVTTPALPPSLYVPPQPAPPPPAVIVREIAAPAPASQPQQPQVIYVPQAPPPMPVPMPAPPSRVTAEPALVIDTTGPAPAAGTPAQGVPGPASPLGNATNNIAGARAGAGVLANRATTVPQGTLIPAVLETALDSTRPGLARAIVSRDVRGFDGSRILIPRGSRLIGEYRSDAEAGQNRMLVNWIRLIRPDGATIAIGSPAGDTLGRGGIRASVNSHFLERFAGAILQSALDIGVNLASRSVDSSVVILPGSQGSVTRFPNQIRPTLKVKAATSISIFVARDLDFTGVEAR